MTTDKLFSHAHKLHELGFAILWLHPESKRPIESAWTTGPRDSWDSLKKKYKTGMNVGVRLGEPSRIKNHFLGVIDVDVKSREEKHAKEVQVQLKAIMPGDPTLPEVQSGRGNGSRHYYILTETPITPVKLFQSKDIVKVHMPSSFAPSRRDKASLTQKELDAGFRMRPAWEIALMGTGQQVVLPPSIHPDSGAPYIWKKGFNIELAKKIDMSRIVTQNQRDDTTSDTKKDVTQSSKKPGPKALEDFKVENVELSWLPIPDHIRAMIVDGTGVEDQSAMLMPVCQSLVQTGVARNEILSILTDKKNFLGNTAYIHAKTADRNRAANWLWRYTLKKIIDSNNAQKLFHEPVTDAKPLSEERIKQSQKDFDNERDWLLDLDRTKDDKIKTNFRNVRLILENSTKPDFVKRNIFAYRDHFSMDCPWGSKKNAAVFDSDFPRIKYWLSNNYGIEPSCNLINEVLDGVATDTAYDPVFDWLKALPKWDEVERLDTWLIEHFNATGDKNYLAQVFRKWIVASVMRILKPGTKFDWMPIFEGFQGAGKSSFGRLLCGEEYFIDWLPDLAMKDSALALQGTLMVEMGELASFKKNEIEIVKAFITRTIDKVRPPYGQKQIEIPRRCVFFGTTNRNEYLKDESGNRRFKPVKVGQLDFEALARDRDQLFAEALWLYQKGFETEWTLEIEGSARLYEKQIQTQKMVVDDSDLMFESLVDFMEKEDAKNEDEKFVFSGFRMQDLFKKKMGGTYAPPFQNWALNSRNMHFAAKALQFAEFRKFHTRKGNYWKRVKK